MQFTKDELVLIADGDGGYEVGRVVFVRPDGCEIERGYYVTFYSEENIHKCPKSIHKEYKRN